jgi:flagellar hook-length control protein FliK
MDKINTQKFNLGVKNNDTTKNDDILGALFTIPEVVDEKKVNVNKVDEFIVNPHIEKVLISKKASKNLGKLEIMYKDFFSNIPENELIQPIFKNDKTFDFNSRKVPNILNLDVKLNKILKINHEKKNLASKLINSDISKGLDIKINPVDKNVISNENEINLLNIPEKSNSILNSNNNLNKKNNVKKSVHNKENLNDIFSKIDRLKEDINSNNFENKMIFNDNEIIYKQLKVSNESNNFSNHNDQINKVENLNLRNNSSQHQFNSDKNINFVLDQMIEELDVTKLGWTEKLILRIEKGLNDDEKQIELALKPKELGNLKINLKIKDKSANIIMKVENAASMVALQSNEGLLTKTLLDQGFILDKIYFENSLMSSNKENKNSSKDNKDNNREIDDVKILDNVENNKDDNLNYLININA